MLFTSLEFLVFFPLVVGIFYLLPHGFRWAFLLLSSYYFYACSRPEYLVLILVSTTASYWAGRRIESARQRREKRAWLIMGLAVNLGLLFAFKYANFFSSNLSSLFQFLHLPAAPSWTLNIAFPIGISFYTFQSMSSTIDVYQGKRQAEHHFGLHALYVAFFPQLLSGPIARATEMLPQFRREQTFDAQRAADGLKLMVWGFIKKIVIADRLAGVVNRIYDYPEGQTGIMLTLGTVLYAYQIYCDFSGYTDIARGGARVLGFDLPVNFNLPYRSTSVREFWKRWHISLSGWLRDYLYIPLGGNRVSIPKMYVNLLLTFLICGLWHGPNWTFILWGLYHGTLLVLSNAGRPWRERLARSSRIDRFPFCHDALKTIITFILICVGWIFFRAASLSQAWYILTHLGTGWANALTQWKNLGQGQDILGLNQVGLPKKEWLICALLVFFLEAVQWAHQRWNLPRWLAGRPVWVRFAVYYAGVLMILFLARVEGSKFIYFQF